MQAWVVGSTHQLQHSQMELVVSVHPPLRTLDVIVHGTD